MWFDAAVVGLSAYCIVGVRTYSIIVVSSMSATAVNHACSGPAAWFTVLFELNRP